MKATGLRSSGKLRSVDWLLFTAVSVPSSRVEQSKKNAGNTDVRSYIGNGMGGDWFSGKVKITNRVRGAQRWWKERKSKVTRSFETSEAIYQSIKRFMLLDDLKDRTH
jgi:hypothetical protein